MIGRIKSMTSYIAMVLLVALTPFMLPATTAAVPPSVEVAMVQQSMDTHTAEPCVDEDDEHEIAYFCEGFGTNWWHRQNNCDEVSPGFWEYVPTGNLHRDWNADTEIECVGNTGWL